MLRISKITDYAIIIARLMALQPNTIHSCAVLARQSGIGEAMVKKIMKQMLRAGLVDSIRGKKGGYRLVCSPELISLAQLVIAIEDSIALTECTESGSACVHQSSCAMASHWFGINQALYQALDMITLVDLIHKHPVAASIPIRVLEK